MGVANQKRCAVPKPKCSLKTIDGQCSLGYECQPVVEKCAGCEKIVNNYCSAYIYPAAKWRIGCPLATHIKIDLLTKKQQMKTRIGQQKQRKGVKLIR